MLHRSLCIALLLSLTQAVAQAGERNVQWSGFERVPDVTLAYRGSGWTLTNPGLSVSTTWTLAGRERVRARGDRPDRLRSREFYTGVELGFNIYKSNNTLIPLNLLLGSRVVRTRGFTTGVFLIAGLNRSVLNRVSWSVDANGELRGRYGAGQFSVVSGIGCEMGWDRERQGKAKFHTFTRPSILLMMPWNTGPVPVVHWDMGVRGSLAQLRRRS